MSQRSGGCDALQASKRSRTACAAVPFSPESPTTHTRTGALAPVGGGVTNRYVASGGLRSAEGWPTAYAYACPGSRPVTVTSWSVVSSGSVIVRV